VISEQEKENHKYSHLKSQTQCESREEIGQEEDHTT